MKVWDVWMEGFADNGGRTPAQKIGSQACPTFDEAVIEAFEAVLTDETICGNPQYDAKGYALYKNEKGHWTYYGCRIYDNEKDARAFLG